MAGLRMTNRSNFGRRGRKHHGFTLVELIVILVIIAILAAAGVATALGYIKKTKYDKNYQTAISVYQTAQTALANKMANGTIERWILDIPGFDASDVEFTSESETNFSQHKTVSLTYNYKTPGGAEDKYLYDFLSPYLYYPTIFGGTLSVEFDICITKDNGHLSYTANVLSAFFSAENDSETGGWDATCLGGSADGLPNRSESYCRSTSLVGYYAGSDSDNVVSSVMLPWDSDYELEGHVVGPVEEERQAKGYLFNVRNAETLDVSWAIFDEDRDPERADDESYIYQYELRADHDERLYIYIMDADGDADKQMEILVDPEALDDVEYGTEYTTYEVIDGNNITRKSALGFVTLTVIRGSYVETYQDGTTPDASKCRTYTFPITRTLVTGDPRTGVPAAKEIGYYEYSLALDSIRVRTATDYNDSKSEIFKTYYGSARLFGNTTPANICAKLGSKSTWNYKDNNGVIQAKTDLYETYAARAINDPVYFEGAGMRDGELKYCYQVKEHCGKFDGEDDTTTYEDYIITGRGVVNTYFGDKVYETTKDPTGKTYYIGGTIWEGSDKSAVLTNCRHLYNIGILTANDLVTYRVVSDINWYYHETYKDGDDTNDKYASEVRVFTKDKFNSPVSSSGSLCVVSFPAIKELKSNSTLTSISNLNRKVYSINNIQLRKESYINKTDTGYALICSNSGTIYNLYANNISNVLVSVADGTSSDYSLISSDSSVSVSSNTVALNKFPVGSLIGHNKGTIGSSTETADNKNTVRVSNSVVMSGGYWQYYDNFTDVGGVIGKNTYRSEGVISTYGVIEVCGSFAVVGVKNTGGIIGYNESAIGARLVVDGSSVGYSEFDLPTVDVAGTIYNCSCAVISKYMAGGAIGYFDGSTAGKRFFEGNGDQYSMTGNDFDDLDDADFNIVVDLPENGLIVNLEGNANNASSAGAISCLYNATGEYLSIRTNISGKILSAYSGIGYSHTGGAIGKISGNDYLIEDIYLDCTNKSGSVIGSINESYGATAAGGAIGKFETNTANLSGTVAINIVNNGFIGSRGNGEGTGAGGAIGGAGKSTIPFVIKAVNGSGSEIVSYGDGRTKTNGAGGAIGGMGENANDNCILPNDTWIYVVNYGAITGTNRVGGAIGSSPTNKGNIYAENYGHIGGGYFVGGAVGFNPKNEYGTVTSVLNGAEISGESFVGGAIGRCLNFRNIGTIETYVNGSSTITGTGYLVGGVGGDIGVADTGSTARIRLFGTSTNPTLYVTGSYDGVGGAVGILRSKYTHSVDISMPTQADLDMLAVEVYGRNDVGGVIGRLMSSVDDNNYGSNDTSTVLSKISDKDIEIKLDVRLNPKTKIIGSGADVGGAVGSIRTTGGKFKGYINVSSAFGYSDENAILISGTNNVGGAIGHMEKPVTSLASTDSGISVDFTSYPVRITATVSGASSAANAGGAVGYITVGAANKNAPTFPITALLGTSVITSGGINVGGAVGYNLNALASSSITAQLEVNGSISGYANVGGAIGNNQLITDYGNVVSIETTIDGTVSGSGDCVGGAVGYNYASVNDITTLIDGTVSSTGDKVGGAIGNCHSTSKIYLLKNVTASVEGSGRVQGRDSVGGAIGENESNIESIVANITGNAKVIGEDRVGGALGYAYAAKSARGSEVLKGNSYGRILSVQANISADYALSGDTRLGGAVGQIGYKEKAYYYSPALLRVEAVINSAYLFDPGNTGTSDKSDACIGGVVGIFVDGRLGMPYSNYPAGVILSGSGGVVHTDYPNTTMNNAILIAATGSSIGGIIGEIGIPGFQQNVVVSNISADNGPKLCVVSLDGGTKIGGWIGSSYAQRGGIGTEADGDKPAVFNVNNVKVVASIGGSEVGGFCGRIDSENNKENPNNIATCAVINVRLSDATIIGDSKVGGAFGEAYLAIFKTGSINVELRSHTNVGDLAGNKLPGDNTDYAAVCYEAGGAIGCIESTSDRNSVVRIPINVVIDATSRVGGMGKAPENDSTEYGVGGVFGRCGAILETANQLVRVTSEDGTKPAVYSANSHAGGIAGVMINKNISNGYANVSVYSAGENACAGGVIGKLISGDVKNCHFGPDLDITKENYFDSDSMFGAGAVYAPENYNVTAVGNSAFAGGFVGSSGDCGVIENCYTTAKVSAPAGAAAGGFAGEVKTGSYTNNYVGGHTYSGQYLSNAGDVTGSGRVGGFVGQTTGNVTFTSCYSTASVSGSGAYAGGFVGSRNDGTTISNCYCTGLVIVKEGTVAGAFAGTSAATNFTSSYAMRGVNKDKKLIGSLDSEAIVNLSFADSATIKGTGTYTGYPFDDTLGTSYPLRAVISNTHWGDWPTGVTGEMSILETQIYLSKEVFEYDKDGVTVENYLRIFNDSLDKDLILDTDYKLTYINNDRVGTAQVMISGIGSYSGATMLTFTIEQKSVKEATVEIDKEGAAIASYEFSGAPIVPKITVKAGDDELVMNTDYYLTYVPDNTNIGVVEVTVHGIGNYKDTADTKETYEIIGRNISIADVTLTNATAEELVYTGNPITPGVVVRIDGRTLVMHTDDTPGDYTVEYINNVHAGEATIKITPCNPEYGGEKLCTFTITTATNVVTGDPEISNWTWKEEPSRLSAELQTKFGTHVYSVYSEETCTDPDKRQINKVDPDALYEQMKDLDAGTYYLLAEVEEPDEYKDDYTLVSKIVPFTVDKANFTGKATVTLEYDVIAYNGSERVPTVTSVTYKGEELDSNNYSVVYTNNIVPGEATVTITGKANCIGTVTATFTINPVYTVTFDANGEGAVLNSDATVDVENGNSISRPENDPTWTGYRFDGWYDNTSWIGPYNFGKSVDHNFTLYAKWVKVYTVTFVLYDNLEESDEKDEGYILPRPATDPVRPGYVFDDWYANSPDDGSPDNKWTFDNPVADGDQTIYAHWTEKPNVTVAFDTCGGTPDTIDEQSVLYNGFVERPADPTYEGHTFAGWYTNAEYNEPFDFVDTRVTSGITLYAKWDDIEGQG